MPPVSHGLDILYLLPITLSWILDNISNSPRGRMIANFFKATGYEIRLVQTARDYKANEIFVNIMSFKMSISLKPFILNSICVFQIGLNLVNNVVK